MKNILILTMFLLATIFTTAPSYAAELLMIHSPSCGYCNKFMRETYLAYGYSKQGKLLPLKVLDVTKPILIEWIRWNIRLGTMRPIRGTPTFIIWDNDKEVDRIVGYGGQEQFYHMLDILIERHEIVR